MDTNQAGATMASRYQVAKGAAIVGSMIVPGSAVYKGGRAVTGSTAYKVYGAVKRPLLTVGVHKKVRGATTAMTLSKAYSKGLITAGILNFGRNLQLAYAKEYRRLAINMFGPPGSLFLYDMYMEHNMDAEADIAEAKEIQSRVGSSLPSKPKTRGKKHSYVPSVEKYLAYYQGGVGDHEDSICRKGYRYVRKPGTLGLCVKR